MPTIGSPCWYTIPALSLPRAEQFYSSVFGWKFCAPPVDAVEPPLTAADYSLFNFMDPAHRVTGCLIKVSAVDVAKESPKSYARVNWFFYVDDLDKYENRIVVAGGEVLEGGRHPQGTMGAQSFFKDTEGNVFGIWTHTCQSGCPCSEGAGEESAPPSGGCQASGSSVEEKEKVTEK